MSEASMISGVRKMVCGDGSEVFVYDGVPTDGQGATDRGKFLIKGFSVSEHVMDREDGETVRVHVFHDARIVSSHILGKYEQEKLGLFCPQAWEYRDGRDALVSHTLQNQ